MPVSPSKMDAIEAVVSTIIVNKVAFQSGICEAAAESPGFIIGVLVGTQVIEDVKMLSSLEGSLTFVEINRQMLGSQELPDRPSVTKLLCTFASCRPCCAHETNSPRSCWRHVQSRDILLQATARSAKIVHGKANGDREVQDIATAKVRTDFAYWKQKEAFANESKCDGKSRSLCLGHARQLM